MSWREPEQLREIAVSCQRMAARCTDRSIAEVLESVSAELAHNALRLDELFKLLDKA